MWLNVSPQENARSVPCDTEPALVMGNGPSLRKVDFHECSFITFGMNAAYRHWREIDWWPDYYSCLDLVVGQSHRDSVSWLIENAHNLGIRNFLLRRRLIQSLRDLPNMDRVVSYEDLLADGQLPKLRDVTTGAHTLLWADRLGYRTILLGGVDCDYVERVQGSKEEQGELYIAEEAENPNYFFPGYQRPGDRYSIPNVTPGFHQRSWSSVGRHLSPYTAVVNLNQHSRVTAFDRNSSTSSYLEAGSRIAAFQESTTPDRMSLARLKLALIRVSSTRRLNASFHDVAHHLDSHLRSGQTSSARYWRSRYGNLHFTWYVLSPDAPPLGDVAAHYAASVTLVSDRNGWLKPATGLVYSSKEALVIAVTRADRIRQFTSLVESVYSDLGEPTAIGRLADLILRIAQALWFTLPRRIRAIDYSGLLTRENLHRLAAQINTRRSKEHSS